MLNNPSAPNKMLMYMKRVYYFIKTLRLFTSYDYNLMISHLFQEMVASAMVTLNVRIFVFNNASSIQVKLVSASNIVYKGNRDARMKKMSRSLQTPYFDYASVNRLGNDLVREYSHSFMVCSVNRYYRSAIIAKNHLYND